MSLRRTFILCTLWILALGIHLELTDQEAYYWAWSMRPALCYFEHPPLQAWITSIFTHLLGDAAWVVRLPATLGRIATFAILGIWARQRWGHRVAELAQWTLLGAFFFAAGSLIALPDSVMMPLALLTILWSEQRRSLAAGLAFGLAGLGKWPAVLLYPGLTVAFLKRDANGKRHVGGWLAASLIAALLQTPVLVWNAQHGWASFSFHLHDRHMRTRPISLITHLTNLLGFSASQVLLGGLGFIIALIFALKSRRRVHEATPNVSLLWWIAPPFLIFGWSASHGELRFYWTSIAFPPLAAALATWIARLPRAAQSRFARAQTIGAFSSLALVTLILMFPVGAYLKPITDLYKHYDLRHSPRGDLIGWKTWVDEDLRPAGWLDDDVAFLSIDFRLASQLAWVAGIHDMTRVGTVSGQFQFRFWPRPTPERFRRVVFFGDNRHVAGPKFNAWCRQPLLWKSKEISLYGHLVKRIDWAVCEQWCWDPEKTGEWLRPQTASAN